MSGYYDACLKGAGSMDERQLETKLESEFAIDSWTALAIYTAGVACFAWKGVLEKPLVAFEKDVFDYAHLLEIRLFSAVAELHAVRDAMGKPFSWRYLVDDEADPDCTRLTINEVQQLDIDQRKSDVSMGIYQSIGGGRYSLPVADAETIKVRSYVDFDEEGMARIVDCRIAGIYAGGKL